MSPERPRRRLRHAFRGAAPLSAGDRNRARPAGRRSPFWARSIGARPDRCIL